MRERPKASNPRHATIFLLSTLRGFPPKNQGGGGTPPSRRIRISVAAQTGFLHGRIMASKYPIDPPPGRHQPVHGVRIDLGEPTIVFLTVCAKDRRPWIGQKTVMDSLVNICRDDATAWLVGEFLLLPDHLHLFCAPRDLRFTLDKWVAFWKSRFSRSHLTEVWAWQDDHWVTRMRMREQYSEKWLYVQENPIREGLVSRIDDWPFKGRVHDLRC
jgi:putative transposase